MRVIQIMGIPEGPMPDADAVVIALKSRSIPAEEAVALSVKAAHALRAAGASQILFKYCSTFDSIDRGNIGPVAEALMGLLGTEITIACPSFPGAGRTTYKGHLFVGDSLLSDSPLKDHPLNPMHDSNLQRVLQRQTALPVGLIDITTIRQGVDAVKAALSERRASGKAIVIVDTLADADLVTLGAACADLALVTGGSGIGMGLAVHARKSGRFTPQSRDARMSAPAGRAAILAGSCSVATLGQIAHARAAGLPSLPLDTMAIAQGHQTAAEIAAWAIAQPADAIPLVYSSAGPDELRAVQARLGQHQAGILVENTLGEVARLLQQAGFARFIIAGGETSGAVVAALGVTTLEIGPEIDPGVPWTRSIGGDKLALALKSGNFGAEDFFLKAWALLQ
jgi:uncharacterized protein YgbK (DUF1537 family)